MQEINERLPHGYPFEDLYAGIKQSNIIDAVDHIRQLKTKSGSRETIRSYNSIARIFVAFVKAEKLDQLTASQFGTHHAQAFMDHLLLDRNLGNNSYNTYLTEMKSIFNMMVRRKYLRASPFDGMKKRKKEEKKRRES